jgi:FAD:protein FMN transferase
MASSTMSNSWLVSLLPFTLCLYLFGQQPPGSSALQMFESVEPHMGTLMRITLYAHDSSEAASAFRAAFARIAALDEALTDYQPQSELNRLTRNAVKRPVKVSDDLLTVLLKAEQFSHETNGAFDVTSGPVTHLWRAARKTHMVPSRQQIEAAVARTGFGKLHIDSAARTVEIDEPGMQLDLGGIAKGYAADQALARLAKFGIQSALVAASGDLTFTGPPPGKPGWRIEVDPAGQVTGALTRVLLLTHAAVSTSGDREQHLDAAANRYSHIVDPHSGLGLTSGMAVTVVAQSGIDADAASTAIEVLGIKAGLAFVERQPQLSAFAILTENGKPQAIASRRFSLLFADLIHSKAR